MTSPRKDSHSPNKEVEKEADSGPERVAVQLPGAGSPGIDVVLGEWALVASAEEAPPGTITFRFRNMGTVPHGLRIRTAGSGKNRSEWRAGVIAPGETALLAVDLAPGSYEIDCPVEDAHGEHDALGMETAFTVHEGAAPLDALPGSAPDADASGDQVTIAGFAFAPGELSVAVGSSVTWHNTDPTMHTVTGEGFDTGIIDQHASAAVTFEQAGTYEYFCAIHPEMRGRVVVGP